MTEARAQQQSHSSMGLITRSLVSGRPGTQAGDREDMASSVPLRLGEAMPSCLRAFATAPTCAVSKNLGREMAPVVERDPTSAAKYADYDRWIPFNVARVGALSGCTTHKPQRILDIGCGPGYFLAGALACGHDCYGIDAPETILTTVEAGSIARCWLRYRATSAFRRC